MRIGILTSGGDCPGLNAAIRAVARRAERTYGDELVGFIDGWKGVLEENVEMLDISRCRGILPRGGTILGTSRVTPYQEDGALDTAREVTERLGIDGYIVVGGNGSLSCAARLHRDGINCIGIPKTIDNDVAGTGRSFGFDTAVSVATEAIGRLHTTAEAHDRVLLLEVMGRAAGHIAVHSGLAGGAARILIPEIPFDVADIADHLAGRHRTGRQATIIVVAEGAMPIDGTWEIPAYQVDQFGHRRLGGLANLLGPELERRTGIEARVTTLGYVQRGGIPTAYDRVLATRFGVAALDAAHDGDWGTMVADNGGPISRVSLADEVEDKVQLVDAEMARMIDEIAF